VNARSIATSAGALELVPAAVDELRGIARYWPMEIIGSANEPGHFGLVFQHGEQEVFGIKLQPLDIPADRAKTVHHVNRALIAAALPEYLAKNHKGVMVPCAYYKEKDGGVVETGIAFFVGPDAESAPASGDNKDVIFDDRLGKGASQMVFDFAAAIARASKALGLPLLTVIGMDVRPRLAIGGLAMHFAIEGPNVFVIKDPLQDDEPVWRYVVGAGFSKLPYAPMKPVGFAEKPPSDTRRV
jgi:hypothetical protein